MYRKALHSRLYSFSPFDEVARTCASPPGMDHRARGGFVDPGDSTRTVQHLHWQSRPRTLGGACPGRLANVPRIGSDRNCLVLPDEARSLVVALPWRIRHARSDPFPLQTASGAPWRVVRALAGTAQGAWPRLVARMLRASAREASSTPFSPTSAGSPAPAAASAASSDAPRRVTPQGDVAHTLL